uniref:Uncharacterized protein n=1 Tax=Arundo donax TaxID=35708 RepID=A0A0A9CC35_ARUDO
MRFFKLRLISLSVSEVSDFYLCFLFQYRVYP